MKADEAAAFSEIDPCLSLHIAVTRLHKTNAENEQQRAAGSIAYGQPRRVLPYMVISQPESVRNIDRSENSRCLSGVVQKEVGRLGSQSRGGLK
jgi:hypothetical protein